MAKHIFHLAGNTYTTKTQVRNIVRTIAAKATLDEPLRGRRFAFMRDLFAYHPRADKKIGSGIESIVVRRATRNPDNREFWLKQTGMKALIDISWTECLHATSALAEFRNACRLAVKPYTQAFADRKFADSTFMICPINKSTFRRTEAHVDHDDPWPFSKIVEEFVRAERLNLETVAYDGFEDGSSFVTLRDADLAARFVAFHEKVATLRVVSAAGNLSRG